MAGCNCGGGSKSFAAPTPSRTFAPNAPPPAPTVYRTTAPSPGYAQQTSPNTPTPPTRTPV